ncbi:MAG TPA: hypothetical protein VEP68_01045, partial [Anaeromyxobacteraceae bacterium]|nr:hypothetical protein [Anaeromyxobacteraceae bacterium]
MTGMPGTGRLALLLCAALAFGCAGKDGTAGADGAAGRTALVNTAPEPVGTHCPAGGVRVDS